MNEAKNRRYDTVIFDLDGTLLDTLADLTNSTNAVMDQYGMSGYTQEQVRGFVGNGIRRLLERAVTRDMDAEEFEQIHRSFRKHYDLHCMDETEPYPGILSLLDWLKKEGYRTAIVSNKADFAVKKLSEIYFKDLVSVAIGEQEGCRRKPAPDSVFRAMYALSEDVSGRSKEAQPVSAVSEAAKPEQKMISDEERIRTVYVGDSEVDILTAKNAGLDCIAVSWGFRSREFLIENGAEPGRIAANVKELRHLLEEA